MTSKQCKVKSCVWFFYIAEIRYLRIFWNVANVRWYMNTEWQDHENKTHPPRRVPANCSFVESIPRHPRSLDCSCCRHVFWIIDAKKSRTHTRYTRTRAQAFVVYLALHATLTPLTPNVRRKLNAARLRVWVCLRVKHSRHLRAHAQ